MNCPKTHPTDALRLVPTRATPQQLEAAAFNLSAEIGAAEAMKLGPHIELAYELLVAAAPASPLPEGGGQLSKNLGQLKSPDLDALEKLAARIWSAVNDRRYPRFSDMEAAGMALEALIAELKEARYLLGHVSASTGPAHDLGVIAAGYKYQTHPLSNATYDRIRAFLARNGKPTRDATKAD